MTPAVGNRSRLRAPTFTLEAPTDAQEQYIRDLCHRNGLPLPDVIASKTEASAIIDAIRAGTYRYEDYEWPWGVPFR